jgi:hypothetical protein
MTIQSQQSWSATILSKGLFNMEPRYWTDNALQYIAEGFSMELYGTINIGSVRGLPTCQPSSTLTY